MVNYIFAGLAAVAIGLEKENGTDIKGELKTLLKKDQTSLVG